MSSRTSHRRIGFAALAAVAALACMVLPASAQEQGQARKPTEAQAQAVDQQNLPSAEEVLKKYVEATGGVEVYEGLKTQRATGSFEIPAMQIEGKIELFKEHPDKSLTLISMGDMGSFQTGLSGDVGWNIDPMQGPRLLEAEELKTLKRDANMHVALKPAEHYSKLENKGIEEVEGEKAYHLMLTPKDGGSPVDEWYSVESGLCLKNASVQKTPMGEIPFSTLLQDYRPIGGDSGLKQPHKIVTTGGGAEYIVVLEKIEANVEMPAGRFEPPAEIKQLIEKQKATPES